MNPMTVVCPTCKAAIGGRCLQKTNWGTKYTDVTCEARAKAVLDVANEQYLAFSGLLKHGGERGGKSEALRWRPFHALALKSDMLHLAEHLRPVNGGKSTARTYFNDPYSGAG